MEELRLKIKTLLELMDFRKVHIEADANLNKLSIKIEDEFIDSNTLPQLVINLNSIARVLAKKLNLGPVVLDVNNYRREREKIIIDLAKAAARKAVATKQAVPLPAMNAYERRLVHTELGMRPDIKTESIGEGKGRYVIIKNAD